MTNQRIRRPGIAGWGRIGEKGVGGKGEVASCSQTHSHLNLRARFFNRCSHLVPDIAFRSQVPVVWANMPRLHPRIREARIDALFAKHLLRPKFCTAFLDLVGLSGECVQVSAQHAHPVGGGTIDLWLGLSTGIVILLENKIDAAWSVTGAGEDQPYRYRASVEKLAELGTEAKSLLLAPQIYLRSSRMAASFNLNVAYEDCLVWMEGEDRILLSAAIDQAMQPYEPEPDAPTSDFFASFRAHVGQYWPQLTLKREPNGGGVRPTGSHTIYFDVPQTLRHQPHLPKPRMSLQAWDSGASSPSVKIMLGRFADSAKNLSVPRSLKAIDGYFRPAGGSLGIVVDTPRLDPRWPFLSQIAQVETGLGAAQMLRDWWNDYAGEIQIQLDIQW